ncbi:MAG: ferrous iron transport protein A [Aquificaceae bacterium]|nr:ferrous iron transport protein A [Aquificaceae bacterium]MCX8059873.1 ferrous iron transport protein A [Aquificaceae bacterium]MDW8097779.1 FeoA family protein [Aquificaceae bacterium]
MNLEEVRPGQEVLILNVYGKEEVLEKVKAMGLREGRRVSLLQKVGRNLLLKVNNSRIVISRELARGIEVQ